MVWNGGVEYGTGGHHMYETVVAGENRGLNAGQGGVGRTHARRRRWGGARVRVLKRGASPAPAHLRAEAAAASAPSKQMMRCG